MAPIITKVPSQDNIPYMNPPTEQIPLGQYLFLRICQANPKARSVFGIPGDFNLALLEHLYTESVAAKLEIVGFCNELNAAYAADGYAKAIGSLSVLITTFGVGEISALNGIAGAFTEYAPVLHIVGTTSTDQRVQALNSDPQSVKNFHHLVQSKNALHAPDHDVYKQAAQGFCVIQESLDCESDLNLAKIDRVLTTVLRERRPGYLYIPSNVSDILVPASRLEIPLDISEMRDEKLLEETVSRILGKMYASRKPTILGDYLINQFNAQTALDTFVAALPENKVTLASTNMARNIDERLPNFIGVYGGLMSSGTDVVRVIEKKTDFLLILGYFNNEMNSGCYTNDLSHVKDIVQVHPDYVFIDGEYIHVKNTKTGLRSFSICDLIARLSIEMDITKFTSDSEIPNSSGPISDLGYLNISHEDVSKPITQDYLIDFFNAYLRPNDILVCETCSFLFGIPDLKFPKGVRFFSQTSYGSIGYTLPATFGISRAERDLGRKTRVILIQGDGSAQMTIQELSTFLRYETSAPEIFLLNNSGYTVERAIKGPTRSYNDIQDTWAWTGLLKVFGDVAEQFHESKNIRDMNELHGLLGKKSSSKLRMYELKLGKLDMPKRFDVFTKNT